MSELCRFRQGEGYGACDDVQGLGKATPQQDSAYDKMSILAKFGPAVESCSLSIHLLNFLYILTIRGQKYNLLICKHFVHNTKKFCHNPPFSIVFKLKELKRCPL